MLAIPKITVFLVQAYLIFLCIIITCVNIDNNGNYVISLLIKYKVVIWHICHIFWPCYLTGECYKLYSQAIGDECFKSILGHVFRIHELKPILSHSIII